MSKKLLNVVGKTEDGKDVVSGVFKMFDSIGLPLSIIFNRLESGGMIPSWIHFYKEAKKSGWKHKTIMSRLSESTLEAYGKESQKVITTRLDKIFNIEEF